VYQSFLSLHSTDFPECVKLKINERWNVLHTESMGFAYLLDPATKAGRSMVGDDKAATIDQLLSYIEKNEVIFHRTRREAQQELFQFLAKVSTPDARMETLLQDMKPMQWWQVFGEAEFPCMYQLALR
jgi:hypothetical protein